MELVLSVLFGLVLGSFLNVFIYRWPQIDSALSEKANRNLSFLSLPLSFCPECKVPIKPWHNIPVVSYLMLRGHCASCRKPIPIQYPIVEILGGLLFFGAVFSYGWGITAIAAVVLLSALVLLSVIDIRSFLIADRIVIPLIWLGLLVNVDSQFATLREAVLGAIGGYLLIYGMRQLGFLLVRKETIGMGDAKLLAALGAWLGYQALPFVLFIGSVFGILYGCVRIALKGNRKRYRFISFGPFISLASAIMLFWGDDIRYQYLEYVGW